ncbi:MAG: alpha/beta hydrolase [Bacteroidales bacterium]|nr:alpha/beta hydrolase [Bacteroidales bacterium]
MDTNKLRLIVCISIIFNFQFSIFNSSRAQWWTGWSQKTSLSLCLHQTDSTYELYSPLQSPEPIAVTRWSLSGDTLRLECASIGLKMTLKRCSPSPTTPTSCSPSQTPPTSCSPSQGELSEGLRGWQGTWRQGLLREPITFLPADTLYQLRRPQTPPHRYTEETLTVDYVDSHGDSIHLEGTLTLPLAPQPSTSPQSASPSTVPQLCVPRGTASHPTSSELGVPRGTASRTTQPLSHSATPLPHPCLMLVSGSGQQNRDEELFHHRPFLVLADYLAAHGIATFRYDDRGVGASTGPLDSATTLTFAEDAEALFNALKRHPAVDTRLLGIGGHSEGAAIAPMVAARNKDVKYVVMLAGQGCSGLDVMVQQNEALFRSRGVSSRLSALRAACMREIFEAYTTTPPSHSATQSPSHSATQSPSHSTKDLQAIILRHTDGLTKEEIDSIELKKGMAYAIKQQLDLPWMQTFLALDPASYLPKVHCPLLALGGDRDCQVLAEPNLQRIKQLCPQAETHTLQGLNHLFQHCTTGAPDEYIQIEETFAPEALRHILDFLLGPSLIPGNAVIDIH